MYVNKKSSKLSLQVACCFILPLLVFNCSSSTKLSKQGLEHFEQKDCDQAVRKFNQAIKKDTLNGQAFYGLSLCHYEIGDYESALDLVSKSISLDYWRGKEHRAEVYYSIALNTADVIESIKYCNLAILDKTDLTKVKWLRSKRYFDLAQKFKQPDSSIFYCKAALKDNPNFREVKLFLAKLYQQLSLKSSDLNKKYVYLSNAIFYDPSLEEAFAARAETGFKLAADALAKNEIERAIRLCDSSEKDLSSDKHLIKVGNLRLKVFEKIYDFDSALDLAEELYALSDNDPHYLYKAAEYFIHKKEFRKALNNLFIFYSLSPDIYEKYRNLVKSNPTFNWLERYIQFRLWLNNKRRIKLTVKSAHNLNNNRTFDIIDPYIITTYNDQVIASTLIREAARSPIFDDRYSIFDYTIGESIYFHVYDNNPYSYDDLLVSTIQVYNLPTGERWLSGKASKVLRNISGIPFDIKVNIEDTDHSLFFNHNKLPVSDPETALIYEQTGSWSPTTVVSTFQPARAEIDLSQIAYYGYHIFLCAGKAIFSYAVIIKLLAETINDFIISGGNIIDLTVDVFLNYLESKLDIENMTNLIPAINFAICAAQAIYNAP